MRLGITREIVQEARQLRTNRTANNFPKGSRSGRAVLWVLLPPFGLWRSIKAGQRRRDERLARALRDK
jgi:hypothetical protein